MAARQPARTFVHPGQGCPLVEPWKAYWRRVPEQLDLAWFEKARDHLTGYEAALAEPSPDGSPDCPHCLEQVAALRALLAAVGPALHAAERAKGGPS